MVFMKKVKFMATSGNADKKLKEVMGMNLMVWCPYFSKKILLAVCVQMTACRDGVSNSRGYDLSKEEGEQIRECRFKKLFQ